MYHLSWQSTALDQARPVPQKRGGSVIGGSGWGAPDAPHSSCSLLAMSRQAPWINDPASPCSLGRRPIICTMAAKPIIHAQFKSKCHTLAN